MIKAIVFDLDDTLILERNYTLSGFKSVSKYISQIYNQLDKDLVYNTLVELYTQNDKNVFNRLLDYYGVKYDKYDILTLIEIFRNHTPELKLELDTIYLEKLRNKGYKLGIISDGYIQTQMNKAMQLDLFEKFDCVLLTDILGREYWKPHPRAFKIMKEKLQVDFEEMMYIGDNPKKDFHIASAYPITTVQINREDGLYKEEDYLDDIRPHYTIRSLEELENII